MVEAVQPVSWLMSAKILRGIRDRAVDLIASVDHRGSARTADSRVQ
jgi:hypothetical protein